MNGQSDADAVAGAFEQRRPRLQALAHRMLGSESEAQDAVQEAWIRLSRSDVDAVDNLDGWLTTVVARVCLDALRARRARREDSLDDGFDADLPVLRRDDDPSKDDPAEQALHADAVGVALLVVLDRLSPAERLAFVLHDMFGVPFDEIAPIVDRTPDAAKMLASRARRRVRGAGSTDTGAGLGDGQGAAVHDAQAAARQREVVDAYLAAARSGDIARLIAVLDPDVELRVELGGVAGTRLIRGARRVAGQAVSYRARGAQRVLVDGMPGLLSVQDGKAAALLSFEVADGLVTAVRVLSDPVALSQLDLGDFPDLESFGPVK